MTRSVDDDLLTQVRRNLAAMARELAANPDADQRAWTFEVEALLAVCSAAKMVTLQDTWDKNCPLEMPSESGSDKDGRLSLPRIVTLDGEPCENPWN